jgi:hypothetical protein
VCPGEADGRGIPRTADSGSWAGSSTYSRSSREGHDERPNGDRPDRLDRHRRVELGEVVSINFSLCGPSPEHVRSHTYLEELIRFVSN